jgi:hypothetical protein
MAPRRRATLWFQGVIRNDGLKLLLGNVKYNWWTGPVTQTAARTPAAAAPPPVGKSQQPIMQRQKGEGRRGPNFCA